MTLALQTPPSAAGPALASEERRKSERQPRNTTAWLSGEAGNRRSPQQQITLNDLSLGGVGFCALGQLDLGSVHWIVIGTGPLRLSSRLRIVSCRPRADGAFDVGAAFF